MFAPPATPPEQDASALGGGLGNPKGGPNVATAAIGRVSRSSGGVFWVCCCIWEYHRYLGT